MTMRPSGQEIACKIFSDETEAINAAKAMARKYSDKEPQPPKLLSGKYAKLRDDIKTALEAGRAAELETLRTTGGDHGTCNRDAAALILPRWNGEKIQQAAKEAGTSAYKWTLYGSARWVISPDSRAQADPRTDNATAMAQTFAALGYDVRHYSQMD